ncbi:MAG: tetratricopeptide repeat protein [Fusobacteria bacterium]|nr:tetratricopeptide repeat protein [Fusobacteriota bacterium]
MKKRLWLAAIIIALSLSSTLLADESDSLRYIYKLSQNGYYSESIDQINQFMSQYPNSNYYTTALSLKGYNYFMEKDYVNAQKTYLQLLNTQFGDEANYYLEMIAIAQANSNSAMQYLTAISQDSTMKPYGYFALANYYFNAGDFDEAIVLFQSLANGNSQFAAQSQLKLGIAYFNDKNYAQSASSLMLFVKIPAQAQLDLALANYYLGLANEQIGNTSAALQAYSLVVTNGQSSPYYPDALNNSAKIYLTNGNSTQFLATTSLMEKTSYKDKAYALEGEYYFNQKQYSYAETAFKSSLAVTANPAVLYNLILTYSLENKYQSVSSSVSGLQNTPFQTSYNYYYVWAQFNLKNYQTVYTFSQTPSNLKVDASLNQSFLEMLATSDFESGNYSASTRIFQKLIQIQPQPQFYYNLILIASKTNDLSLATQTYSSYTKINDTTYTEKITALMSDIYISNNQSDSAKQLYVSYLKQKQNSKFAANLSGIYITQGNYSEAIDSASDVKDLGTAAYIKAIAYSKMGDLSNASKNFRIVVEKSKDSQEVEDSYFNLISLDLQTSQYSTAITDSQKFIQKFPTSTSLSDVQKMQAMAYFKLGSYDKALSIYQTLSKVKGQESYAISMKGQCYYNTEQYDLAYNSYNTVNTAYPKSKEAAESLYWMIVIKANGSDTMSVKKLSMKFIETHPNSSYLSQVILLDTSTLTQNKDLTDISSALIAAYDKANDSKQKNMISTQVSKLNISLENYSLAFNWSQKMSKNDEQKSLQAQIYYLQKNYSQAIPILKSLLTSSTYSSFANYYLGSVYFQQNQYSQATPYLNTVINGSDLTYQDQALFKQAIILENSKDYKNAIMLLLKLKLMYPNSSLQEGTLIKLAQDYYQLQNFDKAISTYQDFLGEYPNSQYMQDALKGLIVCQIEIKDFSTAQNNCIALSKINPTLAAELKAIVNQKIHTNSQSGSASQSGSSQGGGLSKNVKNTIGTSMQKGSIGK